MCVAIDLADPVHTIYKVFSLHIASRCKVSPRKVRILEADKLVINWRFSQEFTAFDALKISTPFEIESRDVIER